MDPQRTSDAFMFARPEIRENTSTLTECEIRQRFFFCAFIAYRLTEEDMLLKIAENAPKKKNGTFARNKVFRIASSGMAVQPDKVLELVGKATADHAMTLSAEFRTLSEEEVVLLENDFLSNNQAEFDLGRYYK